MISLNIADNVLWSGKVLEDKMDEETKALDEYNKMIHADNKVENVLLPCASQLIYLTYLLLSSLKFDFVVLFTERVRWRKSMMIKNLKLHDTLQKRYHNSRNE